MNPASPIRRIVPSNLFAIANHFTHRDHRKELFLFYQAFSLILLGWGISLALNRNWVSFLIGSALGIGVYVRIFSMHHDHAHGAFLDHRSVSGFLLRMLSRILFLTDFTLWKIGHNRHHQEVGHFGIFLSGGISLLTLKQYLQLKPSERTFYHAFRHPLTLLVFPYFTIFIAYFNLLPIFTRSRNSWRAIMTLGLHFSLIATVVYFQSWQQAFALVIFPAFLGSSFGTLLFLVQHTFESADYTPQTGDSLITRSLATSSHLVSGPLFGWMIGEIGYHHIHHFCPAIPFYRLKEANEEPTLKTDKQIQASLSVFMKSLDCFLWEEDAHAFISKKDALIHLAALKHQVIREHVQTPPNATLEAELSSPPTHSEKIQKAA